MDKPILDMSHWQTKPFDWLKIKAAVAGLIIRVQYGSSTVDKLYKTFVASAKANGIPFGSYAYGRYVSVADAKIEARDFVERSDKASKFLVLDVERDTLAACGPENLAAASQAFIDYCKAAGYKVGLYISHNMYDQYGMNKVKADFLWIPCYGADNGQPTKKPSFACDLWQYSQNCRIAGYDGTVDLSLLNGSKPMSYFFGEPTKPVLTKPTPAKPAPSKPAPSKPTTPTKPKPPADSAYMYVVKAGDTLGEIAAKHNTTTAALAKLNEHYQSKQHLYWAKIEVKRNGTKAGKNAATGLLYC
jgi:GH25 family lysozyme M1 (1,4-beta-N-acetylmuramidase)